MTLIPEKFVVRMRQLHGREGEKWTQDLPELLGRCASRFGIRFETLFSNLSWNLILKARQHGGASVVLKLGFLRAELVQELHALRAYAGRGAVRVIDGDDELGALLLEHVEPGSPLSSIEDDQLATDIFSSVFRRLHCPPSTDSYPSMKAHFSGLERYRRRFGKGAGPLPEHWVERAQEYLNDLISSTNESVLLHGDLHHDNILSHGEEDWVVIDPKGIVGDRHFDTIQYLLNYEERGGDPLSVLHRRITMISEYLSLDPRRIAKWGVARGVLEACWRVEGESSDWLMGIQMAERFAKYLT
ncbi:MAG: aminoglycoside phosphotransferase family protein [Bacilli bacterium]